MGDRNSASIANGINARTNAGEAEALSVLQSFPGTRQQAQQILANLIAARDDNNPANALGTTALQQGEKNTTVVRGQRTYSVKYYGAPSTSTNPATVEYGPNAYRIMEISGQIVLARRDDSLRESDRVTTRFGTYLLNAINTSRDYQVQQGIPTTNSSNQLIHTRGFIHYDPGHLIAATLGGPNNTLNLVPMNEVLNRSNVGGGYLASGGYRAMENWVTRVLDGEECPAANQPKSAPTQASMAVTVTYPTSTAPTLNRFVPTGFHVTLTFNNHSLPTMNFTQTTTGNIFDTTQKPRYWG